jgi:hypothetical protein
MYFLVAEGLGHLNEAGVAARIHPPGQEGGSPPPRLHNPDVVPDSPEPPTVVPRVAEAVEGTSKLPEPP